MTPKTPSLVNATAMAKANPATFDVPDAAELAALKPGDLVKVAIRIGDTGERFWVELTEVNASLLTGRIDNDLLGAQLHGIQYNDIIQFTRDNVYSCTPPP